MDWIDELELRVGPPDAAMGTRALDMKEWLRVDDDGGPQRARARALLDERRADVLASTPATDDAAVELGALLERWFAEHRPGAVDDDSVRELDPLAAARRVAEDLCLLTPSARRAVDASRSMRGAGRVVAGVEPCGPVVQGGIGGRRGSALAGGAVLAQTAGGVAARTTAATAGSMSP